MIGTRRRPWSRPSRRRCFLASRRVDPCNEVTSSRSSRGARLRGSRTRTTVFGGSSAVTSSVLPPPPPPPLRRRRRRRRWVPPSPSVVALGVLVGLLGRPLASSASSPDSRRRRPRWLVALVALAGDPALAAAAATPAPAPATARRRPRSRRPRPRGRARPAGAARRPRRPAAVGSPRRPRRSPRQRPGSGPAAGTAAQPSAPCRRLGGRSRVLGLGEDGGVRPLAGTSGRRRPRQRAALRARCGARPAPRRWPWRRLRRARVGAAGVSLGSRGSRRLPERSPAAAAGAAGGGPAGRLAARRRRGAAAGVLGSAAGWPPSGWSDALGWSGVSLSSIEVLLTAPGLRRRRATHSTGEAVLDRQKV